MIPLNSKYKSKKIKDTKKTRTKHDNRRENDNRKDKRRDEIKKKERKTDTIKKKVFFFTPWPNRQPRTQMTQTASTSASKSGSHVPV